MAASNALATTSVHSFGIGAGSAARAMSAAAGARYSARAPGRDRADGRVSSHAAVRRRSSAGERLHRAEADVVRHRRERPGVAQRHRPEAPRFLPSPVRTRQVDVQDRDAIDGAPAELVRRAVADAPRTQCATSTIRTSRGREARRACDNGAIAASDSDCRTARRARGRVDAVSAPGLARRKRPSPARRSPAWRRRRASSVLSAVVELVVDAGEARVHRRA